MAETKTSVNLPVVKHGTENKGVLTFTLENTNVSVANALRRTILSDIDTVVFNTDNDNINIEKNTTRFHNEILKQRLGCIPIHIKDHDIIENLVIELDATNTQDSMVYVTTNNFQIKNKLNGKYLTENEVKAIFPPNKITKEYILFTRLRPTISSDIPGEIIKLQANLKIGNAKEDGMYNVVSTCSYGFTPDKVEQHNQWQEISEKLEENNISASKIEQERKNWYTLQAKRIYIPDSFDFKVESIGVFTNREIIHLACDNIIKRLNIIATKSDNQSIELIRNSTSMINSTDIILPNEDYTIGKVLEYILHMEYYKKVDLLRYVGFIKKHPHDDFSIIRISGFSTELDLTNDTNIYRILTFACNASITLFNGIKESF